MGNSYWVCVKECGVLAIGSCLRREGWFLFFWFGLFFACWLAVQAEIG